jgi:Tol biopolymer transport system component/tRNA A-37 threonylcarbamoyl transferase component Bud32
MIGQTISHYTILEKLGEGGMGVVYKARDTKLDRDVALKFLPAHLAASGNDKARFIQEAKAAAGLSHPNVLSVIDIQEQPVAATPGGAAENRIFIVMDFVDGQTLREKMATLSAKQAIEIATQVADGLAAAHEKGIVHRDVKPENIMVRRDGIAQVMDFGLAKLRGNVTKLTREGSTVGTAGYMSPEQVQGQDVDHRSDIFSLGVLMYELLTGRTPFKAAHETALMYEIVNVNPEPMSAAKPDIDPELDRIVLGCLEKDPNDRMQSAKQVSIDLKRFRRESGRQHVSRVTAARPSLSGSGVAVVPASGSGEMPATGTVSGTPAPVPRRSPAALPWAVAVLATLLAAASLYLYFRVAGREVPVYTASIKPPPGGEFLLTDGGHMALSPDGKTLAYVLIDTAGRTSLWVRKLSADAPTRLSDTEGAEYPFWSPDSRFIGYFIPGKMKKVLASGGPPFVICDAPSGRGASWNADDVIIFSPRFDRTGIDRVSASGGPITHITTVDSTVNMSNARWPHFLPDGKHFLYTTQARKRTSDFSGAMYAASLDGSVNKHLLDVSSNVEYRDGRILYARQDALVAQPFDAAALEFSGDAIPVVNRVGYAPNRSKGVFSSSLDGVLVYMSVSRQGRTLSWIDHDRNDMVPVGDVVIDNEAYLSLDDTRIYYDAYDPVAKNFDIWNFDIVRSLKSRLTFDPSDDSNPVPSPDGTRFAFTSWKEGGNLYVKSSSGTDEPKLLQKSITSALVSDWSPDGRYILYQDVEQTADWDLWYRSTAPESAGRPFVKSEFTEENPRFSPDGGWVAYNSDESARPEVYVRPFPPSQGKWQVSTNGGYHPIWNRAGTAIIYATEQGVMATTVSAAGGIFTIGESKLLIRNPSQSGLKLHGITRDGKMVLVSHLEAGGSSVPLSFVTDWRANLDSE